MSLAKKKLSARFPKCEEHVAPQIKNHCDMHHNWSHRSAIKYSVYNFFFFLFVFLFQVDAGRGGCSCPELTHNGSDQKVSEWCDRNERTFRKKVVNESGRRGDRKFAFLSVSG